MSFIYLILDWYHKNKRDLPWRANKKVYPIWLSEIILQQTRVNQGLSYYLRFIEKFPNVHSLSHANETEVLNLWQGLGYYSRARNLLKTAQIIVTEYDGIFPDSFQNLKKLPGIGPYTAAAIASISYNEKVPAIDGNAFRFYARFFGINKNTADSDAHSYFFNYVLALMPQENPGDFNQAVMEIGARICLPKNPNCNICPVQSQCVAYNTGQINKLPVKIKKVKIRERYFHYFFIQNKKQNEFLIKKRIQKDIWQNLFELPLEEAKTKEFAIDFHNITTEDPVFLYKIIHILTHQKLHIHFYEIQLNENAFLQLKNEKDFISVSSTQMHNFPFPVPVAQFLISKFNT
ncbi:MAG: A/G-specific adenine glycosylase [Flavobacteriaceae bacterium]|nr:A/G-specific adenine glycosylase [Flavobacteriaceae bacterium]